MKRLIWQGIKRFLPLLTLVFCSYTYAQSKALSPQTYKKLSAVYKQIDNQRLSAALKGLNELLQIVRKPYDKAVVLQTLGHVQAGRSDFRAAIAAYRQALDPGVLSDSAAQNIRFDLAQLYLATKQGTEAVSVLQTWFSNTDKATAHAYALLGQAYALASQYKNAINPLQRAIQMAKMPNANWYEALLSMYYETKSYQSSERLLKKMLGLFPEQGRYWIQLAAIYQTQNKNHEALSTLEMAYRDKVLTNERDLLQLFNLYIVNGIPYKAARFMIKHIQHGDIRDTALHRKLLADAWSQSRQTKQAIAALQKLIKLDPDPKIKLQLAQMYLQMEKWQAAESLLLQLTQQTLQNQRKGATWILLGISRFEQGKQTAAETAFKQAARIASSRKMAEQWLNFVRSVS